mgnify:CR=1 FL=1
MVVDDAVGYVLERRVRPSLGLVYFLCREYRVNGSGATLEVATSRAYDSSIPAHTGHHNMVGCSGLVIRGPACAQAQASSVTLGLLSPTPEV